MYSIDCKIFILCRQQNIIKHSVYVPYFKASVLLSSKEIWFVLCWSMYVKMKQILTYNIFWVINMISRPLLLLLVVIIIVIIAKNCSWAQLTMLLVVLLKTLIEASTTSPYKPLMREAIVKRKCSPWYKKISSWIFKARSILAHLNYIYKFIQNRSIKIKRKWFLTRLKFTNISFL